MTDDFDDMFDAVQKSTVDDSPRFSSRPPHEKPEHVDEAPRSNRSSPKKERKEQDNQGYVPWSRNDLVIETMRSHTYKESYAKNDYLRDKQLVDAALYEHGNIVADKNNHKHIDKFYPEYAMRALILSRTQYWPDCDIDAFLEAVLTEWLSKHLDDPEEYVYELFEAIEKEKCMSGTFLRLNLNVVAQPGADNITISAGQTARIHPHWHVDNRPKQPVQQVRITKEPRKDVFTGNLRRKVKQFLQQQNKFTGNINVIYNGLKRNHDTFTHEQSLLGWMGYLVLRAIAERSDGIKMDDKSILVRGKFLTDNHER